jgi:protein disulfide-isomerase A1
MNTKIWILVFLAGLTISTEATKFKKEDGILVLTPQNFGNAYKQYPHLFVEYYAPWCAICKNFAPQYIQLVKILKRIVSGIELAKLDCEEHKEFCQNQGVTGYPTLMYYDNGVIRKFDERPSLDNVLTWIDRLVHPIETIDSYARLHHRRKKNDHSIVLVAPCQSDYASMFRNFSIENPHFKWFHYCENDSKQLSIQPPRVLIKNNEVDNIEFPLQGLNDREKILEKIELHRYPKLKMYEDPSITNMIFERNRPVLLYIADTNQTYQKNKEMLQNINEKTLEYAPVVIFIKDNVGKQAERFLNYFGVKTFPFVLYMKQIKFGEMTKNYFRGKLEQNELLKFAQEASAGKLKQDYKSQPVPAKNDSPVIELVGDNYRDFMTEDKDVIVTYYMQDCNVCDDFVPTFNQAAQEYQKGGSKLTFARINSKENDCGINLIGYPTIKLHKRGGDRKTADFVDKERTMHQLLTFLAKEGFPHPTLKKESTDKPNTNSSNSKSDQKQDNTAKQTSSGTTEQATSSQDKAQNTKSASSSTSGTSSTKTSSQPESKTPTDEPTRSNDQPKESGSKAEKANNSEKVTK